MEKILVVEDEHKFAQDVKRFLEKKGYTVEIAETGEQALEQIASSPPKLIVLDIILPGIDGIAVLRQVRTKHPMLPVIMLTKLNEVEPEEQALESRADDYMMKSRGLMVLSKRINTVLEARKHHDPNADCLVCENLRLYRKSRKVFLGEKEIPLRRQLFNLLLLLMQNSGLVVERERIFDYLGVKEWEESENLSRAVDHYISELRKLVKQAAPNEAMDQFIETIPGVGYSLRKG